MSLSQNNPPGYVSSLFPTGGKDFQSHVLPKIHDSDMGGNSAAYNSNKVGGGKRRHRRRKSRKVIRGRRRISTRKSYRRHK